MEFFAIFLSSFLVLVSPIGVVTDKIIANNFRSRLNKVEQLQVRVDNAPSYQLIQGKVERVRIAGRGLWLTPDIRVSALEIETDPLDVDLQRLRQGGQKSARESLRQPVQAGVRLVLTEDDVNKALKSPSIAERLRRVGSRLGGGSSEPYELVNPRVDFLGKNRIRFQADLVRNKTKPLDLIVESGLSFTAGHSLKLIDPVATVDGRELSPFLVTGFSEGISRRFDLRTLEEAGIMARVLQLNVDTRELEVATFIRADASTQSAASTREERRP